MYKLIGDIRYKTGSEEGRAGCRWEGSMCGTLTAMKGKYANAAEKRRAQAALERRVAEAEAAREMAEAALIAERDGVAAEIARLKESLRAVTAERDAGQGPEVVKQERISEELRCQVGALHEELEEYFWVMREVRNGMRLYLVETIGIADVEAKEIIMGFEPEEYRNKTARERVEKGEVRPSDAKYVRERWMSTVGPSQRGNRRAMLRIDAARGVRPAPWYCPTCKTTHEEPGEDCASRPGS